MNDLIVKALGQYGIIEFPGKEDNPEILKYFNIIGQSWVKSDEMSWCAVYVSWCAKVCGYEHSVELDARSWLKVGEPVLDVKIGDIVIYWREAKNSWKGHVGFPIRTEGNVIWTLGGNQSNMVKISPYPETRVLGFRRLKKI